MMLMPDMIEDSCSEINFKKRDSDFAGMIEVVIGIVFVPIDAVNPPIFSWPSVIETKLPLSKSNIWIVKLRLSISTTVFEKRNSPGNKLMKWFKRLLLPIRS